MYALATGTVTIRRGTTTTPYQDVVDSGAIVATRVLVSIQQYSKRVYDQATQTPRVVRVWSCSAQSNADLRTNDVITDEGVPNPRTFLVTNAEQPRGPAWTSDIQADLQTLDLGQQGG